jgi:hypothetical protein
MFMCTHCIDDLLSHVQASLATGDMTLYHMTIIIFLATSTIMKSGRTPRFLSLRELVLLCMHVLEYSNGFKGELEIDAVIIVVSLQL